MSVFTNDVTVEAGSTNIPVQVQNFPATQPVSSSGNFTVVQPTGTNLHVVVDSGTITTSAGSGSTATITQVTVTNAASISLLAANASRKKAVIFCPTIGTKLYIAYGVTASTTAFSYIFTASNTALEVTNYTGAISAIATGASDLVNVTEIV